MSKKNFFLKYFKGINNFINRLFEKNLNKLNFKNFKNLFINNKIVLTFVALFVIFLSYILLPTFYNQSEVSKELKTQLLEKFNLDFKLSKDLKYNIFPKPHFTTTNTKVFFKQNEISKVNKLKIYISLDNFFSLKNIKIRDLILDKANFNLDSKNYQFFIKSLDANLKNGNLTIINSNIFFRNLDNEVLFINKILKMKYYYDSKETKNILYAKNEIFNIPYSINIFSNFDKSIISSKINLNLINLIIKNELSLEGETRIGKSEFVFNKLKRYVEYEIKKNLFKFFVFDKIDQPNLSFKGEFNFKPFYAHLIGDLNDINLNYILNTNAIIFQILKTEILNNNNIDFNSNINAKNIYNNSSFKNLNLKSKIKDGLIDIDGTKFKWSDIADFQIQESLIFVKDGELFIDGQMNIKIKDYEKIYSFLLTPKNYRNKIQTIDLNFTYNFDQNIAELKDIKVDNKINEKFNKILNNIILQESNMQNKIYLKNLLNKAIKSYAG